MPALTEAQELQSGSKLSFLAPGLPHNLICVCISEHKTGKHKIEQKNSTF